MPKGVNFFICSETLMRKGVQSRGIEARRGCRMDFNRSETRVPKGVKLDFLLVTMRVVARRGCRRGGENG